ncbi:MAG: hypothetical protein Q9207_007527 [Kuettlingeria erythrocarpa]
MVELSISPPIQVSDTYLKVTTRYQQQQGDKMSDDDQLRAHSMRMTTLLESSRYSDLTLICGQRVFPVHRNILCLASRFFAAACDGAFKEAHENRIDLSDDDPAALQRMLTYLYTLEYDDEDPVDDSEENGSSEAVTLNAIAENRQGEADPTPNNLDEPPQVNVSALLNNVLVYALAEKYDIQPLKDLAHQKFATRSMFAWEDDKLVAVAKMVYNTTPTTDRGLRIMIALSCCDYIDQSSGDFLESSKLEQLCTKDGALTFDILKRYQSEKATEIQTLDSDREVRDKANADQRAQLQRLENELNIAKREAKSLKSQLATTELNAAQELATTKKHASQEKAAFTALALKDTKCRHCKACLKVSVREPFERMEDRHVYLVCGNCRETLERVRCG